MRACATGVSTMAKTSLHFLPNDTEEPKGPWDRDGWTRESFSRAVHVSGASLRLASFSPRYHWIVHLNGRSVSLKKARGAPPFEWAEGHINTWWEEPVQKDPIKGLRRKAPMGRVGRTLWELWDMLR